MGLTTRSAAAGAALIVASALAFALDGPVAQAAYRQGLDPDTFGFWRALTGAAVLGGFLATVMLRQLPVPSQLLGAALLVGAAIAVQLVPAHPLGPESAPSR